MTTVVVGAGIIGVTLAHELQKRRRQVTIIERDAPGKGASFGNMASIAVTEWMGHRPAFPDTVPLMSASAKTKGLFYATGHGHLGLTYAATTARLMADLITGVKPPIDMNPYRITRF